MVRHGTQEGPVSRADSLCIMFRTTTSEDGRVGGHKDDTEPLDLAASVAPARIPEVGEVEALVLLSFDICI